MSCQRPPKIPREKGQLREGINYVRGRKDIILILVVMGMISCFGLNFQIHFGTDGDAGL